MATLFLNALLFLHCWSNVNLKFWIIQALIFAGVPMLFSLAIRHLCILYISLHVWTVTTDPSYLLVSKLFLLGTTLMKFLYLTCFKVVPTGTTLMKFLWLTNKKRKIVFFLFLIEWIFIRPIQKRIDSEKNQIYKFFMFEKKNIIKW